MRNAFTLCSLNCNINNAVQVKNGLTGKFRGGDTNFELQKRKLMIHNPTEYRTWKLYTRVL